MARSAARLFQLQGIAIGRLAVRLDQDGAGLLIDIRSGNVEPQDGRLALGIHILAHADDGVGARNLALQEKLPGDQRSDQIGPDDDE